MDREERQGDLRCRGHRPHASACVRTRVAFTVSLLALTGAGIAGCKPQFTNSFTPGFRFDRTFGQPFKDTNQGQIAKVGHFVVVRLPAATVRTISDGTIEFSGDLNPSSAGLGDCLFLTPSTYPITLNDFSGLRALPSPASVVIMFCNLDRPTVAVAAKALFARALPTASDSELDSAVAHFLAHDEGFERVDVRSVDAMPMTSDILGDVESSELHLAAFVADDSGEKRYVNPLPYLRGVVPAATLDAVAPTLDNVFVQTSESGTFADAVDHAIASDNIAGELPRHHLRVVIRHTERTAAAGANVVPYGIETQLTRTTPTPQVCSRGLALFNAFRRDDSAKLAGDSFVRTAPMETDIDNGVFFQVVAWNPAFPAPAAGEEAFNAFERREGFALNFNRIAGGQEVFPGGEYELSLAITDVATQTPQRKLRFTLASGTRLEVLADTNDDHTIDAADQPRDSLRIGRWHTAYAAGNVRNAADPDNFVDQDSERFYVRIADNGANASSGTPDTIRARIGTIDGAAAVNDDLTEVELVETGNSTGVFVSRSQVLTTNRLDAAGPCAAGAVQCEDDEFHAHAGRQGGAPVADNQLNDRSHRAGIDGSVRIVYRAAGATADQSWSLPVCSRNPEERRVARIRATVYQEPFRDLGLDRQAGTADAGEGDGVFTFTDTNTNGRHDAGEPSEDFRDISTMLPFGNPPVPPYATAGSWGGVVDQAHVDQQVRRANLAWSPACISFDLIATTFVAAPRDAAGVDILDDGGFNGTGQAGTDLVIASQSQLANASFDIVELAFVAPWLPNTSMAQAVIPGRHGGIVGENTLLFIASGTAANFRSLAHEMGHALTNDIDSAQPNEIFYPQTVSPPANVDTAVNTYRRMLANTYVDARATRPLNNLGARGNRFLRTP